MNVIVNPAATAAGAATTDDTQFSPPITEFQETVDNHLPQHYAKPNAQIPAAAATTTTASNTAPAYAAVKLRKSNVVNVDDDDENKVAGASFKEKVVPSFASVSLKKSPAIVYNDKLTKSSSDEKTTPNPPAYAAVTLKKRSQDSEAIHKGKDPHKKEVEKDFNFKAASGIQLKKVGLAGATPVAKNTEHVNDSGHNKPAYAAVSLKKSQDSEAIKSGKDPKKKKVEKDFNLKAVSGVQLKKVAPVEKHVEHVNDPAHKPSYAAVSLKKSEDSQAIKIGEDPHKEPLEKDFDLRAGVQLKKASPVKKEPNHSTIHDTPPEYAAVALKTSAVSEAIKSGKDPEKKQVEKDFDLKVVSSVQLKKAIPVHKATEQVNDPENKPAYAAVALKKSDVSEAIMSGKDPEKKQMVKDFDLKAVSSVHLKKASPVHKDAVEQISDDPEEKPAL